MFGRVTIRLGIGPHSRFAMFCDDVKVPGCRPCCHFTVYRIIMAAVWNRAGHYMFALWFLSFLYLFFLA